MNRIGDTVLGCFNIVSELGAGSFATAYLASQEGTDRLAVVKVAHRHLVMGKHGELIRRRAEIEMRAASSVHHPNLVTVYLAGETDGGVPAIAMEFVPGETVESIIDNRGRLSIATLESLGVQVASALAAIHEAGIVHRDLTPANIMATKVADGTVFKVLDFGVAKVAGAASETHGAIGTPRYMAPEQALGAPVPSSDIFSMGAILWWAATGYEFLDDPELTGLGVLAKITQLKEAPDPRSALPDLHPAIASVIRSALQPDATLRPSARAFVAQWRTACQQASAPRTTAPFGRIRSSSPPMGLGLTAVERKAAGPTVLVIEQDPRREALIVGALNQHRIPWRLVGTGADAWVQLRRAGHDIGACVVGALPADGAEELAAGLLQAGCTTPVIIADHAPGQGWRWQESKAKGYVTLPGGELTLIQLVEEHRRPRPADAEQRAPQPLANGAAAPQQGDAELEAPRAVPPTPPPLPKPQSRAPKPPRTAARRTYTGDHTTVSELAIAEFVGAMPELLADLHELLEAGSAEAVGDTCDAITLRASAVGASRLEKLSRTTRAMSELVELNALEAHVDQMEAAFMDAFKALTARTHA